MFAVKRQEVIVRPLLRNKPNTGTRREADHLLKRREKGLGTVRPGTYRYRAFTSSDSGKDTTTIAKKKKEARSAHETRRQRTRGYAT